MTMAKGLEEMLREMLADPGAAAAQADLAQAAALARQEISFRQRAGAAAARLRRAREDSADAEEIATLETEVGKRTRRLEAAGRQASAADLKRPQPDTALAQVFGRAEGEVEKPPLTLAALSETGEVMASTAANPAGVFCLTHEGDLTNITLQLSDASGQVFYRGTDPVSIAAGTVHYLDVPLGAPKPEPGPVPSQPTMPDLTGQDEGVALALLRRIGKTEVDVIDKIAEDQPGIVIAQTPKAGTVLADGTKITLTVRRASGATPPARFLLGYVGSTLEAAEASLKELGLRHAVKLQVDDGPAGRVLAQSPAEGTNLDEVKVVELTVSQARAETPVTVIVPDLIGRPRDLALELVKAADLTADIKETADPAAAGVTAQDPKAGTTVKRGATVILTVNTPPEAGPAKVVVPALKGRDLREAKRLLAALRLDAELDTRADAAPEGQVIGQAPEAGVRLDEGGSVALTVSSGASKTGEDDEGLRSLVREIARDPRADDAGLDAGRIESTLRAGGVTGLDAARALAELPAQDVRERLKLRKLSAATSFRAMLRRALKALG
jgi:beta-lactam-binding protein with PASTA domain